MSPMKMKEDITARGLRLAYNAGCRRRGAKRCHRTWIYDRGICGKRIKKRSRWGDPLSRAACPPDLPVRPAHLREEEKDELNRQISKKPLDNGYAGIFTTQIKGKCALRICAICPDTTKRDIMETVALLGQYYTETVLT